MAFNDDITISKGSYSVSIWTTNVSENYKNEMEVVAPITAPANQDQAPEKATVVDMGRIIHTFAIGGIITKTATKTAKQVKDDLDIIINGARVSGATPATLTLDGDSWEVYVQDATIVKILNDNAAANYSGEDSAEYSVTLKLVEGTNV